MIFARRITAAVVSAITAISLSLSTAPAIDLTAPSGIDVSSHQHKTLDGINWNAVKSDGQSYAFVKATEGSTYINPHFLLDAGRARDAGLKVGAYHYARPSGDPIRQAAAFAAQLALFPGDTLPPVLDLEVNEGKSPAELAVWTRIFMVELQRLTGRRPMVYTYRYFWQEYMGNTRQFSEYPLWLAAYQPTAPAPVGGWSNLAFWQRSDAGRVAGITGPVDMNLFNGTHAQLDSFARGNDIHFGEVLDQLVLPGVDLSGDAGLLILGILALAAGAAAAPAIIEAAENAGIHTGAREFVLEAERLVRSGALSSDELRRMAQSDATVSDFVIMVSNAAKIAQKAVHVSNQLEAGNTQVALTVVKNAIPEVRRLTEHFANR
ncbi:hydrolase [Corynebacterium phocae]|nr:hydrolase [Corynebacterium phocae]